MPNNTIVTILVGFACLTGGYFIGREHFKLEMKTALQNAGAVFSKGIEEAFLDSTPSASTNVGDTKPEKPKAISVTYGTPYEEENFSFTVDRVAVASLSVRDTISLDNKITTTKDRYLAILFTIKNKHDRLVLTYVDSSYDGIFDLADDVGNRIASVQHGEVYDIIGAAKYAEIEPGQSITILKAFEKPLPKTLSLKLGVNLESLKSQNEIEINIPISAVEAFAASQ